MINNKNSSVLTLFDRGLKSLNDLKIGEEFIVKELFEDYEWKCIPIGKRLSLGSKFLNYYLKEGEKIIKKLDKTSQNQQKYVKLCNIFQKINENCIEYA